MGSNLIKVGTITEHMARTVNYPYYGDVYADHGLVAHIRKRHSKDLSQNMLDNPFPTIADIIKKPDYIGIHKKVGGLELVQGKTNPLLVGIKMDAQGKYLYVSTLFSLDVRKVPLRLNKRLFVFVPEPPIAEREIAAAKMVDDDKEYDMLQKKGVVTMAEDRINAIMDQLEKGITDTMYSEKYKAFLKVQSMFHSYSFNNAMLIYMQRPDATKVAGYNTWINKFERNVQRGEKGITILAPCPYKYETDKKVKNKITGKDEIEKVNVEGLRFKAVTVFDVKQTQGKPLPEICHELTGSSQNSENIIKAIKQFSKVPIVDKVITNGAKGYYSRLEGLIAINAGMSPDQTAKTLIHEYAHSQLHNTEASAALKGATKEVQAESVAFIVSNHYGIDTSEYSFEYLASWSSGKELKELKQSFDLIQKTANKFIEEIDTVLGRDLAIQNKQEQASAVAKVNVPDKIKGQYAGEFPAIKHVSDRVAALINNFNQSKGSAASIKDIKDAYKSSGKRVEIGNDVADLHEFKTLKEIVDGIKHAQLQYKQELAQLNKQPVRDLALEATL